MVVLKDFLKVSKLAGPIANNPWGDRHSLTILAVVSLLKLYSSNMFEGVSQIKFTERNNNSISTKPHKDYSILY